MPTIATIALDRCLHRKNSIVDDDHHHHSVDSLPSSKGPHPSFFPALYATPVSVQISDSSPTSDSPNPYLLNHKRRDFIFPAGRHGRVQPDHDPDEVDETSIRTEGYQAAAGEMNTPDRKGAGEAGDQDDDVIDDFFDPRDSISVISSSEAEDGGNSVPHLRCSTRSAYSEHSDFYDAEEFLSDCSISQPSLAGTNFEVELQSLRLSLFEETEKLKGAEEALLHMHKQWQKLLTCFSQLGLSLPDLQVSGNLCSEIDPEEICQEIVVARLVSKAVERGILRAEVEAIAEAVIEEKNHEISRLRDRLQYYEAVNREMSQRNQEVIEFARQRRQRRNTRQKWVWACVGFSITVGVSLFVCSYIPNFGKDQLHESSSDASSLGIMDTQKI
ncbi:hypothetical protein DsansV1_C06g0058781 [Dioscorea sansibarensis]